MAERYELNFVWANPFRLVRTYYADKNENVRGFIIDFLRVMQQSGYPGIYFDDESVDKVLQTNPSLQDGYNQRKEVLLKKPYVASFPYQVYGPYFDYCLVEKEADKLLRERKLNSECKTEMELEIVRDEISKFGKGLMESELLDIPRISSDVISELEKCSLSNLAKQTCPLYSGNIGVLLLPMQFNGVTLVNDSNYLMCGFNNPKFANSSFVSLQEILTSEWNFEPKDFISFYRRRDCQRSICFSFGFLHPLRSNLYWDCNRSKSGIGDYMSKAVELARLEFLDKMDWNPTSKKVEGIMSEWDM